MGEPIKVLNVIAEDRIGGPQLRILKVAEALKPNGIDTVVAIPRGNGGFSRLLSEAGIPFYELGGLRRIRATANPASHLGWFVHLWDSVRGLIGIIRDENIAVVHQNDVTHIQGAIAGRLAKRKVVWHINGMAYPLVYKSFKPLVYFMSDVIVASSQAMGTEYLGRNGAFLARPFEVLYPPIDCQVYAEHSHDRRFRREFDIPDSCPLIAMIGNIYPTKGHLDFLRAAAIIKRHFPEAHFVIVGERFESRRKYVAEVEGEVRRLGLSERLTFTGFRGDIPAILSAIDILVHPSLSESFGMVPAEALAAGKPVVATAVGGVKEIVIDNQTGILVPPRDPAAIAKGVVSLLEQPDLAESLASRGKERVGRLFSTERCAAEHEKVYRAVLANGS